MGKDLKRDAITAGIAILVLTVLFGLVYPLVTTGVSQLLFPARPTARRWRSTARWSARA